MTVAVAPKRVYISSESWRSEMSCVLLYASKRSANSVESLKMWYWTT
jgi:hypothetical protein